MSAAQILDALRQSGVEVKVDGSKLIFRPQEKVTPELRSKMMRYKPALIALLARDYRANTGLELAEEEPLCSQTPSDDCPKEASHTSHEGMTKLECAVTVEAYGETFIVIPDDENPAHWEHEGILITQSELATLSAGTNGQPLSGDMVRAIALTKRQFPGSRIKSHKVTGAES